MWQQQLPYHGIEKVTVGLSLKLPSRTVGYHIASRDYRDNTHLQEGIMTSFVAPWEMDTTPTASTVASIGESGDIVQGSQQRSSEVMGALVG